MTIWPDVVSYDFRFTSPQGSSNVQLLPGRDEVTTYVLSYGTGVADNPQVISYPTRQAAVAAAGRQPNGLAVFSIENAEDVPFGNAGMRDLFNALVEKGTTEASPTVDLPKKVYRFAGRAEAIRNLLDLFSKVAVSVGAETGTPEVPPAVESTSRGVRVNMPRERKLGEFKPLRAGTILHKVLEAALSGHLTVQQIAGRVDKKPKTVLALLSQGLGVQHGIGYTTDDAEHVHVVIPDGKTVDDLTKHAEEKKPREARKPRVANGAASHGIYRMSDMVTAAARGETPEKPVIRSEANKGMQRHFDKLAELAGSDEWDEVRKYPANGSNNYAKMVRQYRDSLVRAHAVQTGEVPPESEAVAAE